MRKEKFDIAVQIHGGGRHSNPFILSLGAKLTLGLKTPDASALDISVPYLYYHNETLRYLEVVSCIGAKTPFISPEIQLFPSDIEKAQPILNTLTTPFIVLHPGATDQRRRWDPKNFAKVGDEAAQLGYNVVVTGVKEESSVVQTIISAMKFSAVDLSGKLSLQSLCGVLANSSLVISNDTGPLHLAAALHTPTIGLFWCGNLINSGPIKITRHRALGSWMTHCPLCKRDIASIGFPFEKETVECNHLVSFVEGITVEEVLFHLNDLLPSRVTLP
jgi:ADP-heptose:LPS heptosyltransferase